MELPDRDWVVVAEFDNMPGQPHPRRVLDKWLRRHGIDWMPFTEDEILWWEP